MLDMNMTTYLCDRMENVTLHGTTTTTFFSLALATSLSCGLQAQAGPPDTFKAVNMRYHHCFLVVSVSLGGQTTVGWQTGLPSPRKWRGLSSQSSSDLREEENRLSQKVAPPEGANQQLLNNAYNFGLKGRNGYSDALDEKGSFIRRIFSPRPLPLDRESESTDEENEDGWSDMRRVKGWKKAAKLPFKLMNKVLFNKPIQEPGTLILVRHGESTWNANKTFTGWSDYSDLSDKGLREVQHAARLLLEGGYEIDVVFTSRLKRAIRSTWVLLEEMNQVYLPVFKSWRLNERHYGALTGLNKKKTAEQLGHDLVQDWRGSLKARPPPVRVGDPFWPGYERKYADLSVDQLPLTESLLDCMKRTSPVWEKRILYELRNGKNVMVVGT